MQGHQAPSPPVALGPDAEATQEPYAHTQTPLQSVLICFLSWDFVVIILSLKQSNKHNIPGR